MWYVLGFLLLLALAQTVFYSSTAGDTICVRGGFRKSPSAWTSCVAC